MVRNLPQRYGSYYMSWTPNVVRLKNIESWAKIIVITRAFDLEERKKHYYRILEDLKSHHFSFVLEGRRVNINANHVCWLTMNGTRKRKFQFRLHGNHPIEILKFLKSFYFLEGSRDVLFAFTKSILGAKKSNIR